jgi:hypothetical protein
MRREFHVRICEGLGVKFPGPTRRAEQIRIPTATRIRSLLTLPTVQSFDDHAIDARNSPRPV